eukprot:9319827-Pyramimonas_sp.AAC.1
MRLLRPGVFYIHRGAAMSRRLAVDPWRCKDCATRGGAPWVNRGDLEQRSKCNLLKGVCYG